jgi:hypothetical protein
MSNITSTIVPNNTLISSFSGAQTVNSLTTSAGLLSQLADVDLQGTVNGSLLIYNTDKFVSRTLTGAISVNANGLTSVNSNAITLGTHTTGSYVATVSGTSDQIIVTGSGSETANVSLSLPQSIGTTSSPTFAGITISGTITNAALTAELAGKQPVGNYSTGGGTATGSNTGDQTITLSGDVSGSGTGSFTTTLKNVGTAGTYNNSSTSVQPFTTDAAGRVSSAGTAITITPAWSNVTNTPTTIAGYGISDAVKTNSNQTVDGIKTFNESPNVPNLTVDSSSTSAVNKAYADNIATGIHVHGEVHIILKTATLAAATGGTVAYTNGASGVGAKLTVTGGSTVLDTLIALDSDIVIGSRVIIAHETNAAHNGIYTISGARELTRATDADSPAKMNGGDFVFVTHGTTYANTSWIVSEPVTIVGTSPVIFLQFSGAGAYDVGNGLQRDGTLFSVKTPVGGSISADANGINLGASGVTANTYGSATQSAVVTVNDKGLVTSASSSTITPAVSSITGLGTGVGTFLGTPSSANLAAAVTGATGSGALVFGTTPTLSSPTISTAITFNATTYNYGTGAVAAHRTALGLGPNETASFNAINIGSATNTGNYIFSRTIQDYNGDDPVTYNPTIVLTPEVVNNSNTTTITLPARNGTVILSDEVSPVSANNKIVKRDGSGGIFAANIYGSGNLSFNREITFFNGDEVETAIASVTLTCVTPGIDGNTITLPAQTGTVALTSNINLSNMGGLGANVATFLATPTSANLAAAVTDETGSGALVFGTTPTLSSPTISTALTLNATTYNYGTDAASAHRTALSINNVDNTSDTNKPISTATQNALDAKANLVDPVRTTLTGNGSTSVYAISGADGLVNPSALIVAIDGALQEPNVDYTVSGGNITFTDPLANGAKAVVISPTNTLQVSNMIPSDGSVTSTKLAPNLTLTTPTIDTGTLTSSTLSNSTVTSSLSINATSFTFGANSRENLLNKLSNQFVYKNEVIPYAEIFDDFPTTIDSRFGTHRWISNSGTVAYYTAGGPTVANYWGAISLTTGTTLGNTANIYLGPSAGANGQTASRFNMSFQTCFCVSTTSSEYRQSYAGGGVSYAIALIADTGVLQLEAANIGGAGINTLTVASGLSISTGTFVAGTRYRLFYKPLSLTQCEVYFASAPWNSSTWTTIVDATVTHPSVANAAVCAQPFITVATKLNPGSAVAYLDWAAIRQEVQR